jgi:hypothetical protein
MAFLCVFAVSTTSVSGKRPLVQPLLQDSAPMRDLGRKAQTVPTMDMSRDMNMTVVAKSLSLAVISFLKSLR